MSEPTKEQIDMLAELAEEHNTLMTEEQTALRVMLDAYEERGREIGRLQNKLNTDSQNFELECLKARLARLDQLAMDVRDGVARGVLGQHEPTFCKCSLHQMIMVAQGSEDPEDAAARPEEESHD